MKIGLWSDSHNFPSLPLMKISAWHKWQGDTTELWDAESQYNKVYVSKVFTESPEPTIENTQEIVSGGSGYDLTNKLPNDIEHTYPDYELFPQYKFALGWLTRGCPRNNHTFCITPKKDGCKSVKVSDVTEFWHGQKEIVLLDQNLLACPDRMNLLAQLADTGAKIDFTGGLDVRYINTDIINALSKIKTKGYHFAWDDPKEDLYAKYKLFAESGIVDPNNVTVYVLVNYWSSHEEDITRINRLRELGLMPYVMIYDKQRFVDERGRWLKGVEEEFTSEQLRHFKTCQHLQRWCNTRKIIKTAPRFDDYLGYRNWASKGMLVPGMKNKHNRGLTK